MRNDLLYVNNPVDLCLICLKEQEMKVLRGMWCMAYISLSRIQLHNHTNQLYRVN